MAVIKEGQNRQGFTLIEILLSIAIIIFLAGISIPITQTIRLSGEQESAIQIISASLNQAQANAQASKDDSDWGVHISSTTVTIFKGSSFDSRVTGFDTEMSLANSVAATGTLEYVFEKFSGYLDSAASTTISSSDSSTSTIIVNQYGAVFY